MSYKRVIFGFAAAAGVAMTVTGCGLAPETGKVIEMRTPDGFVEISRDTAGSLIDSLSQCLVKQQVSDRNYRSRFDAGSSSVNATTSPAFINFTPEVTPLQAFDMDTSPNQPLGYYRTQSDCERNGRMALDFNGPESLVMAPSADNTRLKVVVLAARGKYFTPKVAPF